MNTLLVIGGARSGKSRYAQSRIEYQSGALAFIATAQAGDAEMHERIERHRAERGARWQTYEAPTDLAAAIRHAQTESAAILVDCLTLWLSNLMHGDYDTEAAAGAVEDAMHECRVPIALVTNEVGGGIVPANALARRFRDQAGRLNQRFAAAASEVVLVTAGLPLRLK